jgi:hypothetical protein
MFALFTPGAQSGLHRRNGRREPGVGFDRGLGCHILVPRLPPQPNPSHAALPKQHGIAEARKSQVDDRAVHDPIEDDPRYRQILEAADSEAEQALASIPKGMGFCHRLWRTKQTILIKKYGVVWFSPADINPGYRFD